MNPSYLPIINNAALLLALAILHETLLPKQISRFRLVEVVDGLLIGIIGTALMLTPWTLAPGLIFDTRSVLSSLAGLFFGLIPTALASVVMVCFRLAQGGVGALTGSAVIVTAATLGLLWRRRLDAARKTPTAWELYLFGLVVHVTMLLCMLTLPGDMGIQVLRRISLPVLLVYPATTVLYGLFLEKRRVRRSTEQRLIESEARLQAFFTHSLSGMAIWNTSEPIRCMAGNTALANIAKQLSRATPQSSGDPAPADPSVDDPSVEKIYGKALRSVIDTGQPQTSLVSATTGDGKDLQYEVECFPIFGSQGRPPVAVGGIVTDVTEKRQAQRRLQESEIRYRRLITQMPAGFALHQMIHDEDGRPLDYRFLEMNAAFEKMTGLKASEVIGRTVREVLPDLEEYWVETFGRVAATGKPEHLENFSRALGRYLEVAVYRLEEDRVAVVIADITERKSAEDLQREQQARLEDTVRERTKELQRRMEESETLNQAMVNLLEDLQASNDRLETVSAQLREANLELEAFTYSVSHDLRAPLRGIDGFSKILLEDCADQLDEDGRHYLQRVRSATQRMGHLIDDLLRLSRVSRTDLNLSRVDLSALARAIAAELARENPERRVSWYIAEDLEAEADPRLIHIALANLLQNAWKFTARSSEAVIELGGRREEAEQVFWIRDNGAGFDPRYADKLFGAFQRLHSDAEFEGSGIGLAIVQRIIHRHGGRVRAEGEVDAGAVFYFSLPSGKEGS